MKGEIWRDGVADNEEQGERETCLNRCEKRKRRWNWIGYVMCKRDRIWREKR